MKNFNYSGTFNLNKLQQEIKNSEITIALDYISSDANNILIFFKSDLSAAEQLILDEVINNHDNTAEVDNNLVQLDTPKDAEGRLLFTNTPFSDASGFRFRGVSFTGVVNANSTDIIEYLLTEERWINGGRLLVDHIGPDDKISFEVVDKAYILAGIAYPSTNGGQPWSDTHPNGVILDRFIDGFYIPAQGDLVVELRYPAKILAGLYLRLIYTSTHSLGCNLKCNLYLHWKTS